MEWVVVEAVQCEPVSRANSLRTGNFTGKSAISGCNLEAVIAKMAAPQCYLCQIPYVT